MSESIADWVNKLGLDIHRITQEYNAMPRLCEMANIWAEDVLVNNEKFRTWREQRTLHFEEKVLNDSRLQEENAGPPEQGWKFEKQALQIEKQTESGSKLDLEIISGWVPPELSYSSQPQVKLPLPLDRKHQLSLVEQYAVLGAIYEYGRRGTEKLSVGKWPDDWETPGAYSSAMKSMSFHSLSQYVSRLNPSDEGWLRAMLDDVKNDVSKWAGMKLGKGKAMSKENTDPTFKNLLQMVESNELAYSRNMTVAEKHEKQGSPEALWWRAQASASCSKPSPDEWPGVDVLEGICQSRFGSGLTRKNLQRIRGDLIASQNVSPADVDSMTIQEVVAKHTSIIPATGPTKEANKAEKETRTDRYIRWAKNHRVFSVLILLFKIIAGVGVILTVIYIGFAVRDRMVGQPEQNQSPMARVEPEQNQSTVAKIEDEPILAATATVEIAIRSKEQVNARHPYQGAVLAFGKGKEALLSMSSEGSRVKQMGTDQVHYSSELNMKASDKAFRQPLSLLQQAEYAQITFEIIPQNSEVLSGTVICIFNNDVSIELTVPQQRMREHLIMIPDIDITDALQKQTGSR